MNAMTRSPLKVLFIGVGLLLIAIVSAAAYLFIRPFFLPIYDEGSQHRSEQANFMVSVLTLGDQVYESDISEFSLETSSSGFLKMIGKTDHGNRVYAIPGADPQDYISLSGFMFPEIIFRNTRLPARGGASLQLDEIRILDNKGSGAVVARTADPVILAEVIDRLTPGVDSVHLDPLPFQSYKVLLRSNQLPGLDYVVSLLTNGEGAVYLTTRFAPDDLIPAGQKLTEWAAQSGL